MAESGFEPLHGTGARVHDIQDDFSVHTIAGSEWGGSERAAAESAAEVSTGLINGRQVIRILADHFCDTLEEAARQRNWLDAHITPASVHAAIMSTQNKAMEIGTTILFPTIIFPTGRSAAAEARQHTRETERVMRMAEANDLVRETRMAEANDIVNAKGKSKGKGRDLL